MKKSILSITCKRFLIGYKFNIVYKINNETLRIYLVDWTQRKVSKKDCMIFFELIKYSNHREAEVFDLDIYLFFSLGRSELLLRWEISLDQVVVINRFIDFLVVNFNDIVDIVLFLESNFNIFIMLSLFLFC